MDVLKLCAQAGLVKLGRIALDGSKVKANASRHKAMSYDYMLKEEQRLRKEIKSLLAQRSGVAAAGVPHLQSVRHVRSNFVLVLRRYSMMPGPLPRRYHDEN